MRDVTSAAGWQVTQCDPTWHVSSRSGEVSLNCYTRLVYCTRNFCFLVPKSRWDSYTDLLSPISGVTRLQWARVQVFQKGPFFPPKNFKKQRRANFGPPQRWARVHCTPCTPYCYATVPNTGKFSGKIFKLHISCAIPFIEFFLTVNVCCIAFVYCVSDSLCSSLSSKFLSFFIYVLSFKMNKDVYNTTERRQI